MARLESTPQANAQTLRELVEQVETVIVGKRIAVERALVALLAGGHLLIEDIPGVGKTTLAKAFAGSLGCTFRRIQFTPDLLPSDITGSSIYNQKSQEFEFRSGPVFGNILLTDEINRATPKAQSALLECMEELQVTVDGETHALPRPFLVVATQNQIEHAGTYVLPAAQMDRFLMRVRLGYPTPAEEADILAARVRHQPLDQIRPLVDTATVLELQDAARAVVVDPRIQRYIVDIVAATREHDGVDVGASPRAALGLLHAAQALAMLGGRTYVLPDDIKALAPAVLAHRIVLSAESRARGEDDEAVVADILNR
ncbi:MAG: AAA family ATPase, partial [Armatimonadota bacterium]